MQQVYDLAYFMVYNKELIIKETDSAVKGYIMNYADRKNKFKETQYVRDLSNEISDALYKTIQKYYGGVSPEELLVLFKEEEIMQIINKHYIREWLYD